MFSLSQSCRILPIPSSATWQSAISSPRSDLKSVSIDPKLLLYIKVVIRGETEVGSAIAWSHKTRSRCIVKGAFHMKLVVDIVSCNKDTLLSLRSSSSSGAVLFKVIGQRRGEPRT